MFYVNLGSSIHRRKKARISVKKKQSKRCTLRASSTQITEPNQTSKLCLSITELPYHILADVLSRLPIKAILCCRCVCKEWLDLISRDSDFANFHLSRSQLDLLVCPQRHECLPTDLYFVDLEADTACGLGVRVPIKPKFKLPMPDYTVVNKCRGFLCLRESSVYSDPSVVCNPITGEYVMLPRPYEFTVFRNVVVSGFGFSPSTKEYKVLRICLRVAEVHTLGSDSWRGVGHAPYSRVGSFSSPTFLNTAIHWVYEDIRHSKSIISFDFDKEGFAEISFPSHFGEDQKRGENTMNIGVLGACLFVCDFVPYGYFDIWVMKEYGVQESWRKDFVVRTMATRVLHNRSFQPLKRLSNGEILMICNEDTLLCYDPQKKRHQIS